MSKLRNKLADTLYPDGVGQDYAHSWPIENNDPAKERPLKTDQQTQEMVNKNTEYLTDDRRVKYRVDSDEHNDEPRDHLYDVDPNMGVEKPKTNRIRVRLNPQQMLDDHKQRSYRVNTTAPIRSATDPGDASYELPLGNDPREDEINSFSAAATDTENRIKDEHDGDISTVEGRYGLTGVVEEHTANLKVGSKVVHAEEGLKGEVVFTNNARVTVKWEDMTRERFNIKEAGMLLNYVDDAEDAIGPINEPTIETPDEDGALTKAVAQSNEVDSILNTALAALDEDFSDIEDANPNPVQKSSGVDMEKAKLQRQVKQYEAKEISAIKERAARELVDLMKMKGLVDDSSYNEQLSAVMAMDDKGFELYKTTILRSPAMKTATTHAAQDVDAEARQLINAHKSGTRTAGANGIARSDGGFAGEDRANPFANLSGLTAPIQVPDKQTTAKGSMFEQLSEIFTINSPEYPNRV